MLKQYMIRLVVNPDPAPGLVGAVPNIQERVLGRVLTKGLGHAGASDGENGAAADQTDASVFIAVIEGAVLVAFRAVYESGSAFDINISVGIQAVAPGVYVDFPAADDQVGKSGVLICVLLIFRGHRLSVCVNPVIPGRNIYLPAGNKNLIRLHSLVGCGDFQVSIQKSKSCI